jgi:hypothetical protein
MKKKLRKFSEGGFETAMGKNPMVDEDVRGRAMKFVEDASEESRDLGAPVTRAASKSTSSVSKTVAPPTKPTVDMDAERARMESLTKKQALIPVHPEDYIPGAGLLKPMLKKVVEMGAKRTAKEAAEKATETAAKNVVRKSEEGFNPAEALEKINPAKVHNIAGRKIPVKRTTRKTKSTEGIADDGGSGAFKHGGKVSSASRRADGCAVRGKTRA